MLFTPRIKKEKIWKKEEDTVIASFVTQMKSLKTAEKSLCHILLPTGSLLSCICCQCIHWFNVCCRNNLLYSRPHLLPSSSYYSFFDILYPPRKQQIFRTLQLIRYRLTVQPYFAVSNRSFLIPFDIRCRDIFLWWWVDRVFLFSFKLSLKPWNRVFMDTPHMPRAGYLTACSHNAGMSV